MLGPDGSLYVVNQGSSVVGLDPNFRQLWSIPLGGEKVSAITVGPTGCTAYLVSALSDQNAPRGLLAIDTATGETVEAALPNQADVQSFDNPTLHVPLVLLHPDGLEEVYVAADSATNGSLELYLRTPVDKTPGAFTLQPRWDKPGLWSQPLALRTQTGWQIIALRARKDQGQDQIVSIEWIEGRESNWVIHGNGIDRTQMAAFALPAIDGAGTIYSPVRLSSAYPENQRLTALLAILPPTTANSQGARRTQFEPARFIAVRNGNWSSDPRTWKRLMIGPDGALYEACSRTAVRSTGFCRR